MREHELTHAGGLVRSCATCSGDECELARWFNTCSPFGSRMMRSAHRPDVEDLVHEHVRVAGEPSDVRALTGVAGEHDRAGGRVEAIAERREHRRVLHEDGAHRHTVLVLRIDDDRLHVG